jgi:hypothetical protein
MASVGTAPVLLQMMPRLQGGKTIWRILVLGSVQTFVANKGCLVRLMECVLLGQSFALTYVVKFGPIMLEKCVPGHRQPARDAIG